MFFVLIILFTSCIKKNVIKESIIEQQSVKTVSVKLDFDNKDVIVEQELNNKKIDIENLLEKFEKYRFDKDFVSAMNMITPPENDKEKGSFDHFMGNDLIKENEQPSPRFFNKDKFHILVGYDIEKIEKNENTFFVYVKELRNLANFDNYPLKYTADIQNLIFEMELINDKLIISKYYHLNPTSLVNLKYEGFVSY